MPIFDRLHRLLDRLGSYPWWQILIEIATIWLVAYVAIRFVQGTRAAGALKGALFLLVLATLLMRILGEADSFQRLKFLYTNFLTLLAVTLIVVFQPELRRGLIRLGEPILRRTTAGGQGISDAIAEASAFLSKARFGAIMVIEREIKLRGFVEGGTPIHAAVTPRLLQTIFFSGSALHDLAVVIGSEGVGEIRSAGVQLPLAEPEDMPDPSLGSRHRAAVGVTKECDAIAVVVSEETGMISIAERGKLTRGILPGELAEELRIRLRQSGAGGVELGGTGNSAQENGELGLRSGGESKATRDAEELTPE